MGGPFCKRNKLPVTLLSTWSDKPNKYNEPTGLQIIGIEYQSIAHPTRIHNWTVELGNKKLREGIEAITEQPPPPNQPEISNEGVGFLGYLKFC